MELGFDILPEELQRSRFIEGISPPTINGIHGLVASCLPPLLNLIQSLQSQSQLLSPPVRAEGSPRRNTPVISRSSLEEGGPRRRTQHPKRATVGRGKQQPTHGTRKGGADRSQPLVPGRVVKDTALRRSSRVMSRPHRLVEQI